jgi:cadmium resistance protein CadD (predicted permease)
MYNMRKKLVFLVAILATFSFTPSFAYTAVPDTVVSAKAQKMEVITDAAATITKTGDSITVVVPAFPSAALWSDWGTLFGEPLTWLIALLSTVLPWLLSFLPGLEVLNGKTRHLAVAILLLLGVAIIGWPPLATLIGLLTGVLGYNLFSIFKAGPLKKKK